MLERCRHRKIVEVYGCFALPEEFTAHGFFLCPVSDVDKEQQHSGIKLILEEPGMDRRKPIAKD